MDLVARVQAVRQSIETKRAETARAQANYDQATAQLQAIYTEHGVTSVDELKAKAEEARLHAEELLAAAEAAVRG